MLSRLWFPAAVVSCAIAGMVATTKPVESSFEVCTFVQDTVKYPLGAYKSRRHGSFAGGELSDSLLRSLGITIDFSEADTVPRLTARDTIVVPDSLKETDPFRYRFYVALIDSLTHRIVSDSLKASYFSLMEALDTLQARRDSADRHMLDSLYYRDSSIRAREAFLAWYNSLSPEERKKYDYEQKVKVKMARADSLRAIKEEKQAIRDSIRQTTPRVLDAFAIPDSLQYKRIITWKVDQDFHDVEARIPDTTFNYYFYDYAFRRKDVNATWLGVAGSPVQPYNYFRRSEGNAPVFYSFYEPWSMGARDFRMYNTKTPYTELAYWGTLMAGDAKESDNLRIFTTQNILPEWNFSLLYERWGGKGMLMNEEVKNKTTAIGTNYLGKRYLMHAGFVSNTVQSGENGGVTDIQQVRDPGTSLGEGLDDARNWAVNLSRASSEVKKRTLFLDQQYRIPFTFINKWRARRDSTFVPDTTSEDITTAFVGHSTEWSRYGRLFDDPASTQHDSLGVGVLDNKAFIRLQPWSADAAVSKLDIGIGDKIETWHDTSAVGKHYRENSVYAYAGANGRMLHNMTWKARGQLFFAGAHAGDFNVQADAAYSFYPFRKARKSPVSLGAFFGSSLRDPEYYQRKGNSFNKASVTKLGGRIDIPHWKLYGELSYGLLAGNIYYDTLGTVRQNSKAMSVLSATLRKDFVIANFLHLDNQLLFQLSSDEEVLPLPMLSLNAKYFVQFVVQRNDAGQKVLEVQIGANMLYNTDWYAPAWNPALGVFQNQTEWKYNNGPIIDLFVNAQWKRACIFIKAENLSQKWFDRADYFTAHRYINTQTEYKLGIYWPFYTQPGHRQSSSRDRSGSMDGPSARDISSLRM